MKDFSFEWGDYARYLPAINSNYAAFAAKPMDAALRRRLPGKIKTADFDFFNPKTKLTHWPNGLYTAAFGIMDTAPTIISTRPKGHGFVLGDSGGYSLISGALDVSQASLRKSVLEWQERTCDVGIILDIPTRSLSIPQSGFTRFNECLEQTISNIRYTLDHRTSSDLRLLNVMQGRDIKEAQLWCDAVSQYRLEGLAIAGDTRLDMWFWAKQFRTMLDRNAFDHVTHIHFLGTSQPGFAVLATALQRSLRRHIRSDISVTFDSSLSFRIAQRHGQITTGLTLGPKGLRLTNHTLANRGGEVDLAARFPFSSPLGNLCQVGDIMPGTDPQKAAIDAIGMQMVSNHAVSAELEAILLANRLVDMGQGGKESPVPWAIRQSVKALDLVFAGVGAGAALSTYRQFLTAYSATDEPDRAGDAA